jgi:hypothetical protein
MVLEPFNQQSFLTHTTISLNNKWMIILGVSRISSQPLLNHQIIFLKAATFLIFIETQHYIGCTKNNERIYSM